MCRLFVLVLGVAIVGVQPGSGMMPACGRLIHGGLECCKNEIFPMKRERPTPPDNMKECFMMAKKPPSCDFEKCIALKQGIASEDGTIDKKKVVEFIDQKFGRDSNLAEMVKDNCVNGDISKYGPPDACDLMKQKFCFDVQIVKSCDEWKEDGDCSGMKDLADECIKEFA